MKLDETEKLNQDLQNQVNQLKDERNVFLKKIGDLETEISNLLKHKVNEP